MNKPNLHDKLNRLRTELAAVPQLDDATQTQLQALITDIDQAVESDADRAYEPFSEQIEDLVLKFQAEHPQLTSALNQVATALSNLGI